MRTMDPLKEVVDLRGKEFLRGHQISDADGYVEFSTIFPGWYTGRLPHIHVRTFINDVAWMTHDTQLFFPADVENQVFQSDAYKARGANTVALDRDLVLRGDHHALKALTVPLKKAMEGFEGDMTLAVTL
jgi:protocatechuate 3,4-dioxygenase beta subunit